MLKACLGKTFVILTVSAARKHEQLTQHAESVIKNFEILSLHDLHFMGVLSWPRPVY